MKFFAKFCVITLAFTALSCAQAVPAVTTGLPNTAIIAGVSYNPSAAPEIAGTFAFAQLVNSSSGTFSFTAVDVLPLSVSSGLVNTSISTGVAQKTFSLGSASVYTLGGIGGQSDGNNVGWAFTGGGLIDIPFASGWGIEPTVRFNKGSATAGAGYQIIAGLNFRWGK